MLDIAIHTDLAGACAFWQAGRNGGSSLLRAGARVITGIPHYFCAPYIHDYEDQARQDPQALEHACVLMVELAAGVARSPSQWADYCKLVDSSFAGRGLQPNGENDGQIERSLGEGSLNMPLWGVTLDRKVSEQYGTRFLLEIVGPFPAITAWTHSGIKADEQELITGGSYDVLSHERSEGQTHARLRWIAPCHARVLCDEGAHAGIQLAM